MSAERQLDHNELGNHIDRLYRAALGLCGSREDAEDLVQETFTKVLRKPRFLRSEDDIGYLLRVLRNTFISQRRTAARRPQTAPLLNQPDVLEDPRAVRAESRVESGELYALVSTLPPDFRDALIAVDLGEPLKDPDYSRQVRVDDGARTIVPEDVRRVELPPDSEHVDQPLATLSPSLGGRDQAVTVADDHLILTGRARRRTAAVGPKRRPRSRSSEGSVEVTALPSTSRRQRA